MRGLLLVVLILCLKTMSAQSKQVDIRDNYQKILYPSEPVFLEVMDSGHF